MPKVPQFLLNTIPLLYNEDTRENDEGTLTSKSVSDSETHSSFTEFPSKTLKKEATSYPN